MGDTNQKYHSETTKKEITVFVTGYGPFLDLYPVNSSWSIASSLPSQLPSTPKHPIPIKIVKAERPLDVSYDHVTEVIPTILAGDEKFDIILHIGLAARRSFYTFEQQSYRTPYWEERDVKGKTFSKEKTEDLWPDLPNLLKPTFDCEDVWRRWRSNLSSSSPKSDIRPSYDPGNYLCGFVYYLSMAWYYMKQSKERPVMFLHVPDCPNPDDVTEGRDVTIGLIRALVDSRNEVGIYDPLKGEDPIEVDHVMGGAEIPMPPKSRWDGK
ncbi:peptidase C15, pyroglutamyl peptidase I-like protein [Tothia fuscella]|uniref:Peptidase C15, pyroglutamyl peptidase I-like protein n=1 Tax=Tothia fuscella TaxID=1048955 RepID=A0A9P4NXV6_9PEZI|nr:peptidase C15, pyroglutamyl peptidase I-like protein [Tothia fuscella]